MSKWREITTRANGAFLRDDGVDPAIEHLAKEIDHFTTNSAEAEGENICTKEHHRAHFRFGERSAHAARVAADEIKLELAQIVARNMHLGQATEPGVDAVDDGIACHDFVDQLPRSFDAFARRIGNSHFTLAEGDCGDFLKGQLLAG